MPPKKRLHMTAEQKATLRAYYSSIHPPPEYKDIGIWFQQKYARPIAASSVSDILTSRYKYLDESSIQPLSKRRRVEKWPELEAALI